MNEQVQPYPPNEPWVQGWIEHKKRFQTHEANETIPRSDGGIDRVVQDEIELQAWLRRLSALSQWQKDEICQERDFD